MNGADQTAYALKAAARDAYIYTLPLVAMETARRRRMAQTGTNSLFHARRLLDHRSRQITAPNNDTLYSEAWLDLKAGSVRFELPPTGDRYFSLALIDMWTNNFAVPGTRSTGPDGVSFTLIGPDQSAEGIAGHVIRATTPVVWALARILVTGPEDLSAARAVQDATKLDAPEIDAASVEDLGPGSRHSPWPEYFALASRLLSIDRPPATDLAVLQRIAPLGLGDGFDPRRFSDEEAQRIEAGVAEAKTLVARQSAGGDEPGWSHPPAGLGLPGQTYLTRAAIAAGWIAALPLSEATYFRASHFGDETPDGRRPLRWHIPADKQIPVDGFWSLSMYEPTADGEYFFTENPISRFAIGDRTPGLAWNADGSLDIWVGSDDPGPGRRSNWLPAPPGPYYLILRAYLPRPELLDGRYVPPEPEPAKLEETN
jgi:hypothetical protein